jgi:tryptophanyl-tRNA synthetase
MGLFSYPILMAADILMFNAHSVPVGRDQIQHIEMARDIAARFNHLFGQGREFFVLPEAAIEESVATLPGLDGRKMSKSYDNTVPLFEGGARKLKETIARIVTDSKLPGEAKDPESSSLVTLFGAFASAAETAAFRAALIDGIGWGDAKQQLFERIDRDIAPLRARYEALMAKPEDIEELLLVGARKARAVAAPLLAQLREAVGLRAFGKRAASPTRSVTPDAAMKARSVPVFKQYRESDGRFYFKLSDGDGRVLLQSIGFQSPKDAGQCIAALKRDGVVAIDANAVTAAGVDESEIVAALDALAAADVERERSKT